MFFLVVVYNFAPRTYTKRQYMYMESFVITMMPTVTGFISGYFNL